MGIIANNIKTENSFQKVVNTFNVHFKSIVVLNYETYDKLLVVAVNYIVPVKQCFLSSKMEI